MEYPTEAGYSITLAVLRTVAEVRRAVSAAFGTPGDLTGVTREIGVTRVPRLPHTRESPWPVRPAIAGLTGHGETACVAVRGRGRESGG